MLWYVEVGIHRFFKWSCINRAGLMIDRDCKIQEGC
jgi:hypothetical protein